MSKEVVKIFIIKHQFCSKADPGMEGMLIGQGKANETPIGQNLEEPEEYDADEQVVDGAELEKQQQSKRAENIGMCVYRE